MATQQDTSDDYSEYGSDSPSEVWQRVFTPGEAEAAREPNNQTRGILRMSNAINSSTDPRVRQAYMLQGRMKDILKNIGSPTDNEDPLDYQMRLSHAIAAGTADLNPQMALQAVNQGAKIAQAKAQRSYLETETAASKQKLGNEQMDAAMKKAGAVYQVFDAAKDDMGMPKFTTYGPPLNLFAKNGNQDLDFTSNMKAALADAKAKGATEPMYSTIDSYLNGKGAVAGQRATAQIQGKMLDFQKSILSAQAKSQQPDKVTERDVMKDGVQTAQLAMSVHQMADFYSDPANLDAKTVGAHLRTTMASWASNAASLGWDSPTDQTEAEKLLATKSPQQQQMIIGLAWAVARAGVGSSNRLNLQEIKQAEKMVGDNPNAGIIMQNLASLMDNKANQWDKRLSILGPQYENDPGLSSSHSRVAAEIHDAQDALDRGLKTSGLPAYKRQAGNSSPAASAPPMKSANGWTLHKDKNGAMAYVSPDGKQFEEVK